MATKCCRNLIIDDLLNIIPLSDRCPPIIQFVADITDAVDGTVVGQLTVERYIDDRGEQHIHLYEWDGAAWVELIDTSATLVDGLFEQLSIGSVDPNWDISVDAGVSWSIAGINFIPPVPSIQVWFRNTVNGCIYTNLPIIPIANACFQGVVVYPDFASIAAGVTVGEPAMVADNTNFAPFLYRSIYLWDGAVWNLMLELIFLDAPTFTVAVINSQDADWEFQLAGGAWNDVNFPETNNVDVNFRQISTECVYENDPVVPS